MEKNGEPDNITSTKSFSETMKEWLSNPPSDLLYGFIRKKRLDYV